MEETFGSITRRTRLGLKLSVKDYINKLGGCCSPSFINQLELHDKMPSKELLIKIATVLQLDENHLIELSKQGRRKQFEKVLSSRY